MTYYLRDFLKFYNEKKYDETLIRKADYYLSLRNSFIAKYPMDKIIDLSVQEFVKGVNQSLCSELADGEYSDFRQMIQTMKNHDYGFAYAKGEYYNYFHNGVNINRKKIDDIQNFWEDYKMQLYTYLCKVEEDKVNSSVRIMNHNLNHMTKFLAILSTIYFPEKNLLCKSIEEYKHLFRLFNLGSIKGVTYEYASIKLSRTIRANGNIEEENPFLLSIILSEYRKNAENWLKNNDTDQGEISILEWVDYLKNTRGAFLILRNFLEKEGSFNIYEYLFSKTHNFNNRFYMYLEAARNFYDFPIINDYPFSIMFNILDYLEDDVTVQLKLNLREALIEFKNNIEQSVPSVYENDSLPDWEMNEELKEVNFSEMQPFEYTDMIEKRPDPIIVKNGVVYYKRDKLKSMHALIHAQFKCEIDNAHKTFLRKKDGVNYMEAHHLIPMKVQYKFANSLDVEENIVSLCSHCHNEIHYGVGAKKLIEKLYNERLPLLTRKGLFVSLEELFEYYKVEK